MTDRTLKRVDGQREKGRDCRKKYAFNL